RSSSSANPLGALEGENVGPAYITNRWNRHATEYDRGRHRERRPDALLAPGPGIEAHDAWRAALGTIETMLGLDLQQSEPVRCLRQVHRRRVLHVARRQRHRVAGGDLENRVTVEHDGARHLVVEAAKADLGGTQWIPEPRRQRLRRRRRVDEASDHEAPRPHPAAAR